MYLIHTSFIRISCVCIIKEIIFVLYTFSYCVPFSTVYLNKNKKTNTQINTQFLDTGTQIIMHCTWEWKNFLQNYYLQTEEYEQNESPIAFSLHNLQCIGALIFGSFFIVHPIFPLIYNVCLFVCFLIKNLLLICSLVLFYVYYYLQKLVVNS